MADRYQSFGRIVKARRDAVDRRRAMDLLGSGKARKDGLLPVGNLRSYGDSCHNDCGTLIDMRGADKVLQFDRQSGVLEAEAGILLADLIACAAPHGFFPAVVPGTQLATLGGAIANDVHGKNHHRMGSFGCHVLSLQLMISSGEILACSANQNQELFAATIGGMGLTGLILSASIQLMAVPGLDIEQSIIPFAGLEAFFDLVLQADESNEYVVAWLDQLAGARSGQSLDDTRGLLMTGNHVAGTTGEPGPGRSRLRVPLQPPFNLLTPATLRLFNAAYYRLMRRHRKPYRCQHQSYFFPLDGIRDWNRLYGPGGLYQHQSVVPDDQARVVLPALLAATHRAGQASFLTVLKRFGGRPSPGLLSFPRAGYTLTLDFPNRGLRTLELLNELDRLTVDAGGAVNPYKDARMSPDTFQRSFAGWRKLENARDPAFMSDFWRRTAMKLANKDSRPQQGEAVHAVKKGI